MRKLSPTKAILHALTSVWSYRSVAARIALPWLPVLLLCGIAEVYFAPPAAGADEIAVLSPVQIASFLVSLIAASSMAVSWQRFILRDEVSRGLRIDARVLRYAGFSFLLLVAAVIPSVLLAAATLLQPAAAVLALPGVALIGGTITRLSIRFPALSLGEHHFRFVEAWKVSEGNFWQCLGVFLLSGAITLAGVVVLVIVGSLFGQINLALGEVAVAAGVMLLQLFYAIFNASVFTSLYGFFVERRSF